MPDDEIVREEKPNIENADAPKKRVALVDIDGCMDQSGKLNEELIKKLSSGNYDEIVLFTQRCKHVQAANFKYSELDPKMITADVVQQVSEALKKPVRLSTSIDEKMGKPFGYLNELNNFETLCMYNFQLSMKLAEHNNAVKQITSLEKEMQALPPKQKKERNKLQQKIDNLQPYLLSEKELQEIKDIQEQVDKAEQAEMKIVGEKYPKDKVSQYKTVQAQFRIDTEFDFYDDKFDNLNEITDSNEIERKPTCFLVAKQHISPTQDILPKFEALTQELKDIKNKYDRVMEHKKEVDKKYGYIDSSLDYFAKQISKAKDPSAQLITTETILNGEHYKKTKEDVTKLFLGYEHANIGSPQRDHKYQVTADNFKDSHKANITQNFKERFKEIQGDQLKTQILMQFKSDINSLSTADEIKDFVKKFKASNEFKILDTAQGSFTRGAHNLGLSSLIKTDSVKAMDKIIDEALDSKNAPSLK